MDFHTILLLSVHIHLTTTGVLRSIMTQTKRIIHSLQTPILVPVGGLSGIPKHPSPLAITIVPSHHCTDIGGATPIIIAHMTVNWTTPTLTIVGSPPPTLLTQAGRTSLSVIPLVRAGDCPGIGEVQTHLTHIAAMTR
jgi:hypothetical protein